MIIIIISICNIFAKNLFWPEFQPEVVNGGAAVRLAETARCKPQSVQGVVELGDRIELTLVGLVMTHHHQHQADDEQAK